MVFKILFLSKRFFAILPLFSFLKTMAHVVITDDNFQEEVLNSEIPVLVDFWATWCGPCQMMGPVVDALGDDMEGKVKVGKLNVDENPNSAQAYGIMSIPAFKVFRGGEVAGEIVGAMSKEALAEKVQEIIG
jgi:thioredoxin 1